MQSQTHDLKADHAEDRAEDPCRCPKGLPIELDETGQRYHMRREPECQRHDAGQEKHLIGTIDQHHTQASPPVSERAQLRLAFSLGQLDRQLSSLQTGQTRIDSQFEIKLHAGTDRLDQIVGTSTKRAIATIHIGIGGLEQHVQNFRQQGVPKESMKEGNRGVPSFQIPTPGHEIVALPQLVEEGGDHRKVVGIVGIAHDKVRALGTRKTF